TSERIVANAGPRSAYCRAGTSGPPGRRRSGARMGAAGCDDHLAALAEELRDARLIGAPGGGRDEPFRLVHDWTLTAAVAADPALTRSLTQPISDPENHPL